MKFCPYCKVNIGGDHDSCPLCQSTLSSESTVVPGDDFYADGSRNIWPEAAGLKKQSILFRIQFFILVSVSIVCFSLDFLMDLKIEAHWSILVILWVIAFEYVLNRIMRRRVLIPRIITFVALMISIMMLITGKFLGFFDISAGIIVPIICTVGSIAIFVFCMLDKSQNAMVYMLSIILVIACVYLVLYILPIKPPLAWTICITLCLVALAAIIAFKGKAMVTEIQKRLFM